jgi:hypothetical protein
MTGTVTPDRSGKRRFVLQAIDLEMDCPVLEARFEVEDLCELRALLAGEADADPDLRSGYLLESDQLIAITSIFGVAFDPGDRPVELVSWQSAREVPYLVHTGFELFLMLEGRKPFAKFSDGYPSQWLNDQISRFTPFVEAGRLLSRTISEPFAKPGRFPDGSAMQGIRQVFFAVPGQEWRIDAYLLLVEVGLKSGWNDALERYEGSLLGYEDWQNDWWLGRGTLSWQRRNKGAVKSPLRSGEPGSPGDPAS